MPIRWFCHDAAQIKVELFLEMTQWKNVMSGRRFRAAKLAQRQLLWSLNYLLKGSFGNAAYKA